MGENMNKEITNRKFLRWPQVQARVALSRTKVHYLMHAGDFPAQIRMGSRCSVWVEEEIDAWIDARVKESRCKRGE